jgi:hypothetical protein
LCRPLEFAYGDRVHLFYDGETIQIWGGDKTDACFARPGFQTGDYTPDGYERDAKGRLQHEACFNDACGSEGNTGAECCDSAPWAVDEDAGMGEHCCATYDESGNVVEWYHDYVDELDTSEVTYDEFGNVMVEEVDWNGTTYAFVYNYDCWCPE